MVVVLMKFSVPAGVFNWSGTTTPGCSPAMLQWVAARRYREGPELFKQGRQRFVTGRRNLLAQAFEQMGAPLCKVGDLRCQPQWVQVQAQHVEGRLQQRRICICQQGCQHAVGTDQVPVPVDGQRRIGLMAF